MPDVAEEMGSALARLAVDVVPVDTDGVEAVLVRAKASMAQLERSAPCSRMHKVKSLALG